MIDCHCHIVPSIDDGSPDMVMSLDMARMSAADGVTHLIATPHVFDGVYKNPLSSVRPHFDKFQALMKAAGVEIQFVLGGEVHLSDAVIELVLEGEAPTIGTWEGRKAMLLEMPHGNIPHGADKLIHWLFSRNIQPIIVHPERNKDVMRNPQRMKLFHDMGCLFQLTAGSLCGRFGQTAEATAWFFMEQGWVTLVASDAHNVTSRPPILSEAKTAITQKLGAELAHQLTYSNAAFMLGLAS